MKVLIPIVIGLLVVGCENKQSTKTNLGDNASTKPLKKKLEKETPSKATDYKSTEINPRKTTATEVSITVIESGNGLEHNIQIEAVGRFRLFFEAKKNYGITRWYDLAGDPTASTDLLHNPTDYIPIHAQGAIFNQCLNPHDLIAHVASGGHQHKAIARSIRIIEKGGNRAVLENEYSPMLGRVNTDLVFNTRYEIYPDGRILVQNTMKARKTQKVTMWRNAIVTLGDPTYGVRDQKDLSAELIVPNQLRIKGANWKPNEWQGFQVTQSDYRTYDALSNTTDTLTVKPRNPNKPPSSGTTGISSSKVKHGWVRCDSLTQPIGWHKGTATYVSAHWDPKTPAPYSNWTKASILLVPDKSNPRKGTGGRLHGWRGCKRVYFETDGFEIKASESITQKFLIQLGSKGASALMDLSDPATCAKIAAVYNSATWGIPKN